MQVSTNTVAEDKNVYINFIYYLLKNFIFLSNLLYFEFSAS